MSWESYGTRELEPSYKGGMRQVYTDNPITIEDRKYIWAVNAGKPYGDDILNIYETLKSRGLPIHIRPVAFSQSGKVLEGAVAIFIAEDAREEIGNEFAKESRQLLLSRMNEQKESEK